MDDAAVRLIQSLQEEQDVDGVRAFLAALDPKAAERLVQLLHLLITDVGRSQGTLQPASLLAVLLCSTFTSYAAIDVCLQLISSGELQCQAAVFCVSEIRQALINEVRLQSTQVVLRHRNDVRRGEGGGGASTREALRGLLKRAADLLTMSTSSSDSGAQSAQHLNQLVLMLDILTPLLILARHVDTCYCHEDEAPGEEEPLARATIRRLLDNPWPPALTLQLLNACQDMATLLEDDDWVVVQSRVRDNLRKCHPTDLPGLSRQCLTIAESCGGQQQSAWIQLLREIFRALPSAAAGTTELVMEQCIKQSLACVEGIVRELEASVQLQQQQQHRQQQLQQDEGDDEDAQDVEGDDVPLRLLSWQDSNLLLLLMRAATAWPLQAVLDARPEGKRSIASPRHLGSLLLSMLSHLAADDDLVVSTSSSGSSAAAADAVDDCSTRRVGGGDKACAENGSSSPPSCAGGGARSRSLPGLVLVERMSLVVIKMLTQDRAPRLALGRVVFQRGSQLFHLAMQWMQDAETVCQDLRRRHGGKGVLRAEELRQLSVLIISSIYGELPEAQATTLSTLLTAIIEQSTAEQGEGAAGPRRALLGYVHALEAITSKWSCTLRQHSQVFQQLIVQLPLLPSRLACTVLEAVAPLACTCPAFFDGLLAGIRKGVAQSDINSRTFATTALMALLAQQSGLLSLADRCQEVSSVFDSLLTLSLPLHLKSRLYRAVTRTVLLRFAPTAPHLRESMGKRLARFISTGTSHKGAVLSPLSLYHEYSVQGSVRVTPRDDLPELLRCVLSLASGEEGRDGRLSVASLIAGEVCRPGSLVAAGSASDSPSSLQALMAAIRFLREGCPMKGSPPHRGAGVSCDPDSVSTSEKLHLLVPLTEVLVDAVLDYPDVVESNALTGEPSAWSHSTILSSCMQLYTIHGMLSDVADALGVKSRDRWPHLDGRERDGPCLSLRSAVYLLQLVILEGRGRLGDDKEGGRGGVIASSSLSCEECQALSRRYRLWALQHALLACRAELEAQSTGGRWTDPEAQKSQSFSLKGLLILLMDLHDLCATPIEVWKPLQQAAGAEPCCVHQAQQHTTSTTVVGTAAGGNGKGKASLRDGEERCKRRPLWVDFLSSVDARFRDLVHDQASAPRAEDEALTLVRANIVQCIRTTLRLCPMDTLEGDEIFAFFEPPSPPSTTTATTPDAAGKSSPVSALEYKGLPYLVNSMVTELRGSLGQRGLPLRLVQSYLDLFEVLFSRITATDTDDEKLRYQAWRSEAADGFATILLASNISQSTVVRRFLKLAMGMGPPVRSIQMSCGVSKAVIRYFDDWVKDKHADGEVITAKEARGQLMEEGDEFFVDNEYYYYYNDDGDEEKEEGSEEEELEDDEHGQEGGGGAAASGKGAGSEKDGALVDLSDMRFASDACWQAATSGLLTIWEGLLGAFECEDAPAAAEEAASWSELFASLSSFFKPVDGAAARRGAKGRMVACMLPSALKARLLAVIARVYVSLRLAASRVAGHLRSHAALGEDAEQQATGGGGGGGGGTSSGPLCSSLCLVVAYLEEGLPLEGMIKGWVTAERGRSSKQDAGLLKRFPPLLFAVERVQVSLNRLSQQVLKHKQRSSGLETAPRLWGRLLAIAKRQGVSPSKHDKKKAGGTEDNQMEEDADEEEEEPMPVIGRSRSKKRKRRLRSRNVVVDRWLEDEDGLDAYADLEDFIAPNEII